MSPKSPKFSIFHRVLYVYFRGGFPKNSTLCIAEYGPIATYCSTAEYGSTAEINSTAKYDLIAENNSTTKKDLSAENVSKTQSMNIGQSLNSLNCYYSIVEIKLNR